MTARRRKPDARAALLDHCDRWGENGEDNVPAKDRAKTRRLLNRLLRQACRESVRETFRELVNGYAREGCIGVVSPEMIVARVLRGARGKR